MHSIEGLLQPFLWQRCSPEASLPFSYLKKMISSHKWGLFVHGEKNTTKNEAETNKWKGLRKKGRGLPVFVKVNATYLFVFWTSCMNGWWWFEMLPFEKVLSIKTECHTASIATTQLRWIVSDASFYPAKTGSPQRRFCCNTIGGISGRRHHRATVHLNKAAEHLGPHCLSLWCPRSGNTHFVE